MTGLEVTRRPLEVSPVTVAVASKAPVRLDKVLVCVWVSLADS